MITAEQRDLTAQIWELIQEIEDDPGAGRVSILVSHGRVSKLESSPMKTIHIQDEQHFENVSRQMGAPRSEAHMRVTR